MTWGMVAVAGATLVGGYMASESAEDAASTASDAQSAAAEKSVAEQKRQFNALQELLKPYAQAGTGGFDEQAYLQANPDIAQDPYWGKHAYEHYLKHGINENRPGTVFQTGALTAQQNLLGLRGNAAQQAAIKGIQESSQFKELTKQAEGAILQNASATGGLRGGNTQAALAQFRPALLNSLIQQQFQNLGGLTSIGQNAAAGVGNAGMQSANSISNLLTQQGAAQAGAALAQGKSEAQQWGLLGQGAGMLAGSGLFGGGSGGGGGAVPVGANSSGFLGSGITGSAF